MTHHAHSTTPIPVTARPLRDDDDVRRVRRLLENTYPRTPLGFNWEVRRWDGQRYYQPDPALDPAWATRVHLWETVGEQGAGKLVAVLCWEGAPGQSQTAHLLVDPDWRALEGEMLAWAERHRGAESSEEGAWLETFVYAYDVPRQKLLRARGYTPTDETGVTRRMRLAGRAIPEPRLADGYTLRTTRAHDGDCAGTDCQAIADLLNAAFNRDFHNALEYHTFTQYAPSFRRDLDLVAVAPDGTVAAYVGIPYDETNRHGIFEPVCTHPQHRRLGLAQTLMLEGMRRLQARGAQDVTVETGDAVAANRLYDSLGFDESERGVVWKKQVK